MSKLAVKKGAKPDQARMKKVIGGCLGVLALGYVASSQMASSAASKPKPKLTASANVPAATPGAPGAVATGAPTAAAPAVPGQPAPGTAAVPTTTPWVRSPRNPFAPSAAEG